MPVLWKKTYLSYPAMYTHMKTKHYYSQSGEVLMTTGRGRGRPRKNYGRVTKLNPESSDYFKTLDKSGGPTDPMFGLEDVLISVHKQLGKSDLEVEKYPFWEILKKWGGEVTPTGEPDEDQYGKLSEEERNRLSCDEIFAVYLREVSQRVNEGFYKMLLKYIICYREWANQVGWQKSNEGDKENQHDETNDTVKEEKQEIDYTAVHNAEIIPELCNDFITVFMVEHNFGIERADSIDMTRNLCNWLYVNGHTCSKLSMAS